MSAPVVRINVAEEIRQEFLKQFSGQSKFETRKEFTAHLVSEGLKKLDGGSNPPGSAPRDTPTANGGNKGIEFSRPDNRDLIAALKKFRTQYHYLSLPIAHRACLYAGLNIKQPWV